MLEEPRKLSEILKEMGETQLREAGALPSSQAAHFVVFLANVAWNESLGVIHPRDRYRNVWEPLVRENPRLWNELKSTNIDDLIDELVRYKKTHFRDDRRRIICCGMVDGRVHVDWLPPAEPGVDPQWDMRLYGLVRAGRIEDAIRFLKETQAMSRKAALRRIAKVSADLEAM